MKQSHYMIGIAVVCLFAQIMASLVYEVVSDTFLIMSTIYIVGSLVIIGIKVDD